MMLQEKALKGELLELLMKPHNTSSVDQAHAAPRALRLVPPKCPDPCHDKDTSSLLSRRLGILYSAIK